MGDVDDADDADDGDDGADGIDVLGLMALFSGYRCSGRFNAIADPLSSSPFLALLSSVEESLSEVEYPDDEDDDEDGDKSEDSEADGEYNEAWGSVEP